MLSKPATSSSADSPPSGKDRVLIVDDEKDNLEALRRLLRNHYDVTITTSPFEALKVVQVQEFNVIVSDQRMPEMSGVEFLEKVKNVCPASTRILLTGYTDIESVIGAINRGHIYRYIAKPWDPEDLKLTLRQANEAFLLRRELEKKNEALVKSNAELHQALDELRLLDRAKARFLSLISHELNTPLTVLGSFATLLEETKSSFPPDLAKAITSMQGASNRLGEIVTEVITYVKLETETGLSLQDFDLKQETLELQKGLEKEFAKKAIRLQIESDGSTTLPCDAQKMKLALKKLLTDACHRSPAKKVVKVDIKAKGRSISYSVSREGEALSAEAFQPLETAAQELHHHRNLGLSLAMCRLIIEGHRGEVMFAFDGTNATITLMLHLP